LSVGDTCEVKRKGANDAKSDRSAHGEAVDDPWRQCTRFAPGSAP
jgi:hypothetical protein